jgi:hypothetical protein
MKTNLHTSLPRRIPAFLSASLLLALVGFGNVVEAASIRFLPLGEELADRKIGLQDGKRLTELDDLNPKKRSKAYPYTPGDAPPILVALDRERPGGIPSGVDIILTAEMKAPLVLILADKNHPSGMRTMVIEDSEQGFAWGTLRFINTADKPFMIRGEKETIAIRESLATIDIAPGGEPRNIGVQLYAEEEPEAVLYSAVWEHDTHSRKIIFIVPHADPATKEIKLEIIPQDKRAEE